MRLRGTRRGHFKKPLWYPTLSNTSIQENNASNGVVGILSTTDSDNIDITYSIIEGDISSFNINGNELRTSSQFNFELKSLYNITIRAADSNGLAYDESFSISVTNQNETPTDIFLSNNSITEYNSINSEIGTLSTSKPSSQPVTYTIVGGDISSFNIDGDKLKASVSFIYATKSSYSVTIRADSGGEYLDKTFNISIIDYSYTYNGRITNSSTGAGISGATVKFSASAGSTIIATGTTDSNGYYSAIFESSGTYYVTVTAAGYNSWSGTLNIATTTSISINPSIVTGSLTNGFQGISGTSGLSPIFAGDSDDNSYKFTVPLSFKFLGIEYGNDANGGIYYGTNQYITFGVGFSVFSNISPSNPGKAILLNARDNRLYELYGGTKTQNGISYYHLYCRGTSYSLTSDVMIMEILFFPNNKITINYGTMTNVSGINGISNGSAYIGSWTSSQNKSIALEGNADGSSWTVHQGSYWAV